MVESTEYEAQPRTVLKEAARRRRVASSHLLRSQLHDHMERLEEVCALRPPRRIRLLHHIANE